VESKVKSMLIIFFDIKGNVDEEFVLAGQTVSSAYFCDVSQQLCETCEDIAPNFGYRRTGYCVTTMHHLTLPDPPYFSLCPRLKIRVKGRHFDTPEVIVVELQAALGTLTEHYFQNAFKKWQKHLE
jgi:hypothetical protein